jgi:ABC-2 type transport system ATP-binding protein
VSALAEPAVDVPAVDITGLVKAYGPRRAVDELSLTVERGTVLALLGPNGAGKTTTVEICEGFRRPDAGLVRVLGLDPILDGPALRPRVGVMLQQGVGGYTAARAVEMLELFASYAAHPMHPSDLLETVGLADVADTAVKRLSGGQQQRLSLAMALVGRPELVFLDEPTAGMDPQSRRATWDLVRKLRADGVTAVLTTHFLDEAEQLADRVVVIDHGRVVAAGTPAELTRSGAEGQIRFRARTGLPLDSLRAALPASAAVAEEFPEHYLVTGEVSPQLLATLTAWCAAEGVLTEDLSIERRSLEDVFLELTGRELRA